MVSSAGLFTVLVLLVSLQRLYELKKSRINEERILMLGGREHAPGHFRFMQIIHTAWLISMLAEVWFWDRSFSFLLFFICLPIFLMGQFLRVQAMQTLGNRWTVRILTLPGEMPVAEGIYRYVRHPNYVGVALELFALPLLHSAYLTALVFSVANGFLMLKRIGEEERGLAIDNDYEQFFKKRPRFLPKWD